MYRVTRLGWATPRPLKLSIAAIVLPCLLIVPLWAQTLDLTGVPAAERLWVVFQDFLEREDRTLRDFPPPGGKLLAAYRADGQPLTSFMAVYERNMTSDQLHAMREVERIRTTIEYLERNLGGDSRETAALITSLRQALLERAAAFEVLRLTRREYARPLLDEDVVVQCTAYWRPLQRRQSLKGDIRGLDAAGA